MSRIDPDAIRQGDRRALARALTAVENNQPESRELQAALFPHTGRAHLIGITGAPGTGKSTLVNQLVKNLRRSERKSQPPKIAIIAVDPSSPFTGGALLGDRIRMQDLAGDKGIFIRSMASRGALGGLAHTTAAFATILDGAGFDIILIETVGAGQAEVDIALLAHTVIVVEAPGLGDDIQAIKAGLLEIADILVVNKADRPGADNTASALKAMLEMTNNGRTNTPISGKHFRNTLPTLLHNEINDDLKWETPVHKVIATEGKGIEPLADNLQHHKAFLLKSGLWQKKEAFRIRQDLEALIKDVLVKRWLEDLKDGQFEAALNDVIQRKCTPYEALESLL